MVQSVEPRTLEVEVRVSKPVLCTLDYQDVGTDNRCQVLDYKIHKSPHTKLAGVPRFATIVPKKNPTRHKNNLCGYRASTHELAGIGVKKKDILEMVMDISNGDR